jgi:hypothetical protein
MDVSDWWSDASDEGVRRKPMSQSDSGSELSMGRTGVYGSSDFEVNFSLL